MWEGLALGGRGQISAVPARGFASQAQPLSLDGGREPGEGRDPTRQTPGVHSLPPFCQGKFLINGV